MHGLLVQRVDGSSDDLVADWRRVHNTIIPNHRLSLADVRERSGRNRLEVARLDGVAVGCSTVRPPSEDPSVAMVIARVLPEFRGRGFGGELYGRGLAAAAGFPGVSTVETLVLEQNEAGLRFALAKGFMEIERYPLPGDVIEIALGASLSSLLGQ
ncbi:hypothetical protein SRB5_38750 [Streptomyces sp. RB5]|uniref:N-acetyltransferase domain-containing protein n=1 Tax=Streptomyces smaragdinus TaxID=2585196 RepID=A0A7K0CLT7_9ACTN|nr:GNAT family N-acetyltransferase [Streptomyces smaragdinus]MQY13724.1 hypothetical protein [Streptomyces smaragdinus]